MGSRYDARPLAIRDDRLALFEITVDAGDQPVEMLVVGELDVEGRLRGVVQFDSDDLAVAQDELDRRYSTMLTDEEAATLEPGLRFRSAMSSTGTAEMSEVLAQGFVAVDHRAIAFPNLDRDGFLEINQRRDELFGEALVFTTEIHLIEGDVIVASNRMAGLTPDSRVEWLHEFVNIFIVRDGELHGLENFDPDDLDGAMARARRVGRCPLDAPADRSRGCSGSVSESSTRRGPATSTQHERASRRISSESIAAG